MTASTMSAENPKKKTRAAQLSKEQLIQAVRKKRECNARANNIIRTLLEPRINGEEFLQMVKHINQCHYEDVVEERFITKLCAYPVCDNILVEIPAQTYHISTTVNKVYDITERKRFCSTNCFKASEYIKSQMLTSPLWLRDQEDIPEFKLLRDK